MSIKNKRSRNNFLRYSGLAFQMAATIGLGVLLGFYLDKQFQTEKIFTAICSLLFVLIAIYIGIKDFIRPNDK